MIWSPTARGFDDTYIEYDVKISIIKLLIEPSLLAMIMLSHNNIWDNIHTQYISFYFQNLQHHNDNDKKFSYNIILQQHYR